MKDKSHVNAHTDKLRWVQRETEKINVLVSKIFFFLKDTRGSIYPLKIHGGSENGPYPNRNLLRDFHRQDQNLIGRQWH